MYKRIRTKSSGGSLGPSLASLFGGGGTLPGMNSFNLFMKPSGGKKASQPKLSEGAIDGAAALESLLRIPHAAPSMQNATVAEYNQSGGASANYGTTADAIDPIQEAFAKLYKEANAQPANAGGTGYSSEMIKQMLGGASAAGAPFDAQIASIKSQNVGARQDAKKGQKKIQALYRALAADDANMGQQALATQQQLAQQINQQAATGNTANQANTQALMSENAKYGGDIAAQLNSKIAQTATQQQGVNTSEAASMAAAALAKGGNYNQQFAQNSSADRLEGTNKTADLISNLQSYLQGNRNKIAELAGQKQATETQARQSILSQIQSMQGKTADNAYKAQQDRLKNNLDILKTKLGYDNSTADNARADQLLQMQLDKASGSSGLSSQDILKALTASGAFRPDKNTGKVDPKTMQANITAILQQLMALQNSGQ